VKKWTKNVLLLCDERLAIPPFLPICEDPCMPKLPRRAGPFGLALTAYDVWKKLPPERRKKIVAQVRKHGPKVVKEAATVARAAARRAKP
jgi:hypothetical protein